MPTSEQQAKLRALAAYFNGGGTDPNAARAATLPPAQDVPSSMFPSNGAINGQMGAGTFDDMAAQRAKNLQQNNLGISDPNPLGMQPAGNAPLGPSPEEFHQVARQFPKIHSKLQGNQPITKQDIQEMTPEKEAEMFPKDEDDDNNKAGTAEGSY